jgi:hypothetical protein
MKCNHWIMIAALCAANSSLAANWHVRSGATGNNTGTDWTNAYQTLPSKLVRGDTYYIADGNYGPYLFNTPNAGTALIVITKATIANHGTSAGWNDAYGDGEALFSSTQTVWMFAPNTGYYEIRGQRGTDGMPGSYGIRLRSTASRNSAETLVAPDLSGQYSATGGNHHVYFDRIEFDWNNGTAAGSSGATRAIQWNTANQNTGIHISNCFIHHSSGFGIYAASIASDYVVDGCVFDSNGGATNYHHETLWVTGTNGFTFRNNVIRNTLNGALTGWLMLGSVSNASIYNNVFSCSAPSACATGGNGIIATWDSNTYANTNIEILNNTFANLPTSGNPAIYFYHSGGAKDLNVTVANNLFFTGSFSIVGASAISNSACGGGASCSGTNAQAGLSTSIFRNWATQDLRLTGATAPGVTTAYLYDRYGVSRVTDGNWDRGAFEYSANAGGLPPPSNLRVAN